jgi:hypothetical protein
MIRYAGMFAVAATLIATAACDKPGVAEQQKEQTAAQDNAEQQNRAARESASAQADMNDKVNSARADFEKTRDDYRHAKASDIEALDAKIDSLENKDKTATGKAKIDLDSKLPAIRAQRASFGADFRALQATTASTWDDAKTRVDKEWSDLKSAVNSAD